MGQRVRIVGQPLTAALNRVVTEQAGAPPQVLLVTHRRLVDLDSPAGANTGSVARA